MDPRQSNEPEVEAPEAAPSGGSRGEVISMVLFGIMVIIASVCFVIW